MAFRAPIRRIALARPAFAPARAFHATPRAFVKVGDELPAVELFEDSPGNTVNLAEAFKAGDGYIIGVPGAFTGTCSSQHVPSYINHPRLKEAGQVFVVSVNDPFVMKAWRSQLDPAEQTGIRFLADPTAAFVKALDLSWDGGSAIFGGPRSSRFALKIENGKVSKTHIEPDATGADVSMAEKVLTK
ncbi:Redoxin [Stachybotrys elegans]|uniref:Redoxin n=1 Tax=Stachybotrys elegans TaxID=80388 RepID=A0A8K0SVW7_9HYPO|nr:Redoxin [Stachybotrys elegans]